MYEDEKPCVDVDGIKVCVVRSKDLGKRDIIITDPKKGARSMRSVTELINKLSKDYDISMDRITDEVLPFVNRRLRDLGEEADSTKISAFDIGYEKRTYRKTNDEI
ncbi:MAG: hypothetical protein H0Z28_10215 [Archaeoglobus sp.]|nr:hypothetical protein [Archaeoglobus sp.]